MDKYIAVVTFTTSISNEYNAHSKQYDFFCDIAVKNGDTVVVDTVNGLGLAEVVGVKKESSKANNWVVQKVDLGAHAARKERERALTVLEKAMEKRLREINKLKQFETAALGDPEMAELLARHNDLKNGGVLQIEDAATVRTPLQKKATFAHIESGSRTSYVADDHEVRYDHIGTKDD
jgi:hypothetical protein